MESEFEEKQFEVLTNIELAASARQLLPIGQVLEGLLGFDFALHTDDPHIWNVIGIQPRPGVDVADFWDNAGRRVNQFPAFRLNLFIQYKRPEFIASGRSREWSSWRQPYFRYTTRQHQHEALRQLAARVEARAAACYCSPAFHRCEDLFRNWNSRTLLEQSNFAECQRLPHLSAYTYDRPGNAGRAFSEPIEVVSRSLEEIISSSPREATPPLSNTRFIKALANAISDLVAKLEVQPNNTPWRIFNLSVRHFAETHEFAAALRTIQIFALLTRTIWFVRY